MFYAKYLNSLLRAANPMSDDDSETVSREASPGADSPQPLTGIANNGNESPQLAMSAASVQTMDNVVAECMLPAAMDNINGSGAFAGANSHVKVEVGVQKNVSMTWPK